MEETTVVHKDGSPAVVCPGCWFVRPTPYHVDGCREAALRGAPTVSNYDEAKAAKEAAAADAERDAIARRREAKREASRRFRERQRQKEVKTG